MRLEDVEECRRCLWRGVLPCDVGKFKTAQDRWMGRVDREEPTNDECAIQEEFTRSDDSQYGVLRDRIEMQQRRISG